MNKKTVKKEVRDDGIIKKRIEMMLTKEKILRFIEIDKLIKKYWGDFSNTIISSYMSFKIPFKSRLFFQKIAHNREYKKNYCNDLDNEIIFTCLLVVDSIKIKI